VYRDGDAAVVESYLISGMGHAVALDLAADTGACAASSPAAYFEDHGICSTQRVADFFGLTGDPQGGDDGGDTPTDEPTDPAEPGGTSPPSITITAPRDGATVSGTVTVTVDATDDRGVAAVEFSIDGALQVTDRAAPFEFEWTTGAFGPGDHEIMALARDADDEIGTDAVLVTVSADGTADNPADPPAEMPATFQGCQAVPGEGGGLPAAALLLLAALVLATRRAAGS
jgi:hypothetical protein